MSVDRNLERLDELERKGKKNLERARAKRKKKDSNPPRKPSANERAANTIASESREALATQLLAALLPMAVAAWVGWRSQSFLMGFAVFVPSVVAGFAAIFIVLRARAEDALARERRWVEGLPFPMEGWFDVIAAEPESGKMQARLYFEHEEPDAELLRGLVGVADGRLLQATGHIVQSPEIEVRDDETDALSNGGYLRWQRKLVREVLIPLHKVYPLRRIEWARD